VGAAGFGVVDGLLNYLINDGERIKFQTFIKIIGAALTLHHQIKKGNDQKANAWCCHTTGCTAARP
jgi:hypothetical protein